MFPSGETEVRGRWVLVELPLAPIATWPQGVTRHGDRCSPGRVPRWRLAREGPFLAERSFGAGYAFRNTTYRASDYASPSGEFGVPLNHPRFLGWIGVPESASLLEMGPEIWTFLTNMPSRCSVLLRKCWI